MGVERTQDGQEETPATLGRPPLRWYLVLLLLAVSGLVLGWFVPSFVSGTGGGPRAQEQRPLYAPELPPPDQSSRTESEPATPNAVVETAPSTPRSHVHVVTADTSDAPIYALLVQWRRALLSNDAAQIAPLYSATMDQYLLQTHVDRAFVRHYLEDEEARGLRLQDYTFGGLRFERNPDGTVGVHFVGSFRRDTPEGVDTGTARTELKLRKEDGEWKIASERS